MCEIWKEVRDEGIAKGITGAVAICRDLGRNDSDICPRIMKHFRLTREEAETYLRLAPKP